MDLSSDTIEKIELALWGYYSENRTFPYDKEQSQSQCQIGYSPANLMKVSGLLSPFGVEDFDGGSDNSFWYFSGGSGQEFVVCTSLGGYNDEKT